MNEKVTCCSGGEGWFMDWSQHWRGELLRPLPSMACGADAGTVGKPRHRCQAGRNARLARQPRRDYGWRMDLSDFRREYSARGLHREDLDADPVAQFARWFAQATDLQVPEPNAMSLATVEARGMPCQRAVLLKYFDAAGFVFFTNYGSRKAAQIAANPQVCALFPWITLERQVIIQGRAEKISTAESLRYFSSRPRESQIGAWVSNQSEVITSRKFLLQKLSEIREKFSHGEIPLPSFWGGYRIVPEAIEFWQGGPARLHDRFLYQRSPGGWNIARLSP